MQSARADPNALLLAARTSGELEKQRKGLQGTFCRNRQQALERYKSEAMSNTRVENPRTAQVTERLVKWYNDKLTEVETLHLAYLQSEPNATRAFLDISQAIWSGAASTLVELESKLVMPFALGDQVSLSDLHITAWLARVFSVACNVEGEKDEVAAMGKALQHEILRDNKDAQKGLGEKVKQYWASMKARPSFQAVYGEGLH